MDYKHNLIHKELNARYYEQPEPKPTYKNFLNRVLRRGYTKEDAIKVEPHPRKRKGYVDDNGRECSKCGVYKPRNEFSRTTAGAINGRTPMCLECRNEKHRLYRMGKGKEIDKIYRTNRRKLSIGQQVFFNDEVREILDYQARKGYKVKSIFSGKERRFSTSSNFTHPNNLNAVRSFRVLKENIVLSTEPVKEKYIEVEDEEF